MMGYNTSTFETKYILSYLKNYPGKVFVLKEASMLQAGPPIEIVYVGDDSIMVEIDSREGIVLPVSAFMRRYRDSIWTVLSPALGNI